MSVLPDWLIQNDITIEPFAENLARPGVISYGVTSYGYDVRVGRNFKVFTNARCVVVDPKNFDPLSFVDFEGDHCLIPPNSFALAETVEYLEIPRDIIAICVGKSTYARCFRGDTRVALSDGSSPTLEQMANRSEKGEKFTGYGLDGNSDVIVTPLEAPRFVGRDTLLQVKLDHGEDIFATPDHRFMRRDGRMIEAARLRPGDSLMPLYREMQDGRDMVYQPRDGRLTPSSELAERKRSRPFDHSRGAWLRVDPTSSANSHPPMANLTAGARTGRNHKVESIRPVAGVHDVYCLTVPETGNFALQAGVFVHNCGIIVNVTPLEPEWRGKVTIEISNTTPLPAKIYAGEGIAQILFLRGEAVCQRSYADKKGKYQDQKGLTLPFVQGLT